MSEDHNQYQKERSYLDDRRDDSYVQLVDDKCERIVWRNQSFRLPIEWVGLTDEELREAYISVSGNEWCLGGMENAESFYEAIEAKLKEKNHG